MKFKYLLGSLALVLASSALAEPVWIDVRTLSEYQDGHVEGAKHVPYTDVEGYMAQLEIDKDATIYLYGRSGRRSSIAMKALDHLGYTNISNLETYKKAKMLKNQAIAAE